MADTETRSTASHDTRDAEDLPAKVSDAPLMLEAFLPYRLSILAESVSLALSKIYSAKFGIGIPEWRVVATVGQYGRITARDVGVHSRMHKTKVSRAVAALEVFGYVARHPNPDDMRESFLELTPKGQEMYRELVPQALSFSERLLATLPEQQQRDLNEMLLLLQNSAENLDRD